MLEIGKYQFGLAYSWSTILALAYFHITNDIKHFPRARYDLHIEVQIILGR